MILYITTLQQVMQARILHYQFSYQIDLIKKYNNKILFITRATKGKQKIGNSYHVTTSYLYKIKGNQGK